MSTKENQALVRQLLETTWNTDDLSLMEAHPGLYEIIPTIQRMKDSGTNPKPTVTEIFGEAEWVAVRMLIDLTPMADIPGMPGVGSNLEVIQILRVVDGIIVKQHSQAGRSE